MKSSEAISRKNIVGAVEITQTHNQELKDKTNREGLIENDAYADFVMLLKSIIRIVEHEFSEDRKKLDKEKRSPSTDLRPAFERLDSSVKTLAEVSQPLEESARHLSEIIKSGRKIGQAEVGGLTEFVRKTADALNEVRAAQITAERVIDDSIEEFASERDLLLGLSGVGLAAERFTHEFARLTREASETLDRIRDRVGNRVPAVNRDLSSLGAVIDALQNDIRALGPLFYVRRTTREKELNVKKVVENAFLLNDSQIRDNNIQVEVQEQSPMTVMMREGPCTQVFNNLIDNACHWLSRKADENDRRLRIVINGIERTVLVSNNGPGVPPKFRHRIFDPFFTTKSEGEGRGLGLYITQEILAEKQAVIVLSEDGDGSQGFQGGVSFLIRFPELIQNGEGTEE